MQTATVQASNASTSEPVYLLCVDDEKSVLDTLSAQIETYFGDQYYVEVANSGEEALEVLEDLRGEGLRVPVVISDQLMPGMKGDELLVLVHRLLPDTRKILLTGQAGADAVGRALNEANLYRYLTKPWDKTDLMMTIEEAANSFFQQVQISEQNSVLESLYFASKRLSKERRLGELAARLIEVVVNATRAERGMLCLLERGVAKDVYVHVAREHNERPGVVYQGPMPDMLIEALSNARTAGSAPERLQEDLARDPYLQAYRPESLLPVRLEHDGQLLGVLLLEDRKKKNAFGRSARDFAQLFASEAALSLDKATLYEQLELRVEERTREVQEQKAIIEEKNQDITDSIRYASRIQKALNPDPERMAACFADFCLLYQPKDIVSGDFFWFAELGGRVAFAAADCTGHGVPGAMMAVLARNLLDAAALTWPRESPGYWLSHVHMEVIRMLGASQGENLDGMDVGLCAYNPITRQLAFSGANRPLWRLRGGVLEEIKGDKTAIGGHTPQNFEFAVFEQEVEKGDRIFLFSDGIVDQFGGPQARKFTPARLRDLIVGAHDKRLQEFQPALAAYFREWIGGGVQTDDILLLGVEFD